MIGTFERTSDVCFQKVIWRAGGGFPKKLPFKCGFFIVIAKIAIIQMSPPRTGSTLLYNAICGLFSPGQPIIWADNYTNVPDKLCHLSVIKTHALVIEEWCKALPEYELFFISSERRSINKKLPSKSAEAQNHLVFQYEELLETDEYKLTDIVQCIGTKCRELFPASVKIDFDSCLERLVGMNVKVIDLKDEPFEVWDKFYGIHGGHRNRGK